MFSLDPCLEPATAPPADSPAVGREGEKGREGSEEEVEGGEGEDLERGEDDEEYEREAPSDPLPRTIATGLSPTLVTY